MPTYVYKFIDSGETIEVYQEFTDSTLTQVRHPADGKLKKVKKVFQPVGVTFKGSGFYKTDSRGSSSKSSTASSTSESSSSDSASSTSSDTKTSETKSSESKSSESKSSDSSTTGTPKPAKADKKPSTASTS
jgi:predicted nucleic acid-binding Zn ribbon protein